MVEHFYRQLKEVLRSHYCGAAWAAHLPWVLDSGLPSAELVYGQPLGLPDQPTLSTTPVAEGVAMPPPVQPALPTRLSSHPLWVPDQLVGATHVYVHNGTKPSPFSPPFSSPYVVLSPLMSYLAGGQRRFLSTVSRCTVDEVVLVQAVLPMRGRPRRD
jgi:hypothetical protein